MKKISLILLILFSVSTLFAVSTSFYLDDTIKDFERGQLRNITINEKGELYLAPTIKKLLEKKYNFIWDVVRTQNGDLIAAAGLKGRIIRISKNGQITILKEFASNTITIRRLLVTADQRILAATSPKGAIYAINAMGKTEKIVEFEETYIWDMTLATNGKLYVATGNKACIYEVSLKNKTKKKLFHSKKESHFLCSATNKAGYLFFGSEGEGRLYKMNLKTGKTVVLFDTYEDEISCLHINKDGDLFFATATQSIKRTAKNFSYENSIDFREKEMRKRLVTKKLKKIRRKNPLRNSIYKVDRHDRVTKIFTMHSTSFYSLTSDSSGNLFAGTGDFGVIYKITPKNVTSRLLRIKNNLILKLLIHQNKLYVATGNEGSLIQLNFQQARKGSYTSMPYDCYTKVIWGAISWIGNVPQGTEVQFFTRTGNTDTPDESWSKWALTDPQQHSERITSPSARYIQYKVIMQSKKLALTPKIQSIKIPFLRQNRAPRVKKVLIRYYSKISKKRKLSFLRKRCLIAWYAVDDDRDKLVYSVYFRFADDSSWRLFRSGLRSNKMFFNTSILPDGYYYFKIVASDKYANTASTAKTGWKDSKKFLIDNSAPRITNLKATTTKDKIIISGTIKDDSSAIAQLRYSLNAHSWHNVHPSDMVFDSRTENFRIVLDRKKNKKLVSGKNVIIIRAADTRKNWSISKIFFYVQLKKSDFSFHNNEILFFTQNKLGF